MMDDLGRPWDMEKFNDDTIRYLSVAGGSCAWCGRWTRLRIYREPGNLDYRIPPRASEPAFCSRDCHNSYHH